MDYYDFVKETDLSDNNIQFYIDGMTEENGEISGIFKRVRRGDYGSEAKSEIDTNGLKYILMKYQNIKSDFLKEMGDRHWYSTRLLQEIECSWSDVETINMEKLSSRKENGTIMGKGDNR